MKNDWAGYIRCDYCQTKILFDMRIPYCDLNLCHSCNSIVHEKKKNLKKNLNIIDEYEYKKNLNDKPKNTKKK